MRHRKKNSSRFGLKQGPRQALLRGLTVSLAKNERIRTTLVKARALRPIIEKAITRARKDSVHSKRLLLAQFPDKQTVSRLIEISKRFKDCPGGYTRIVKLGTRPGDSASKALIEFKDYNFKPRPTKEEKEKQRASAEYKRARRLSIQKTEAKKKRLRKQKNLSRSINRPL